MNENKQPGVAQKTSDELIMDLAETIQKESHEFIDKTREMAKNKGIELSYDAVLNIFIFYKLAKIQREIENLRMAATKI